jgi:hypothetical protein
VAAAGLDVHALSAAVTWLGDRLDSLAAIGEEPSVDESRLVGVMIRIWLAAVYVQ